MGLFDGVQRALGIGGGGNGYQAAGPDPAAFNDPNAEANKKRVGDFLAAYQQKQPTYAAPQVQATTGAQMGLVNTLQNQVNGTGPTVAGAQLQRGQEDAMQNQLALAAANHGADAGSVMRNTARNIATGQAEANSAGAILRAQEQNQAATTLGNVTQGIQTLNANQTNQGEQLVQQYLQMGLGIDQANFLAKQKMQEIQSGVNQGNMANQQRSDGALLGLLGTAGAAYMSSGSKGA